MPFILHSSINKYLANIYCVPDTTLDTEQKETNSQHSLHLHIHRMGQKHSLQINMQIKHVNMVTNVMLRTIQDTGTESNFTYILLPQWDIPSDDLML